MKLVIAGGRNIPNAIGIIKSYMYECFHNDGPIRPTAITEVVSGTAAGVDRAGELWAEEEYWWDSGHTHKGKVHIERFPAEWNKYGRSAGHIRNKQMAVYGDALLLIWDGKSKGSANMKANMNKLGKPVFEVIVDLKHKKRASE